MYKILLVDDDVNMLKALRRALTSIELHPGELAVESFSSPVDALRRAQTETFDLVISDYRMPVMNGVSFLAALRDVQPYAARIMLTGCPERDIAADAINHAQVARFLTKPWDETELRATLRDVLLQRELMLENRRESRVAT